MDGVLANFLEILHFLEGPLQEPLGAVFVSVNALLEFFRQAGEVGNERSVLLGGELCERGVLLGHDLGSSTALVDHRDFSEVVAWEERLGLLHQTFVAHQLHGHFSF